MMTLLVTESSTPCPYMRSMMTVVTVTVLGTLRSLVKGPMPPSEHIISSLATVHGSMPLRQLTTRGGPPDLGKSMNGRKWATTALSIVTSIAMMFRYAATTTIVFFSSCHDL